MSDYILNPYQGNILTGTVSGEKLSVAATKVIADESKRLTVSLDNALEIKEHCMKTTHIFGWEDLLNIPHRYTGDDTRLNIINMLEQPAATMMQMVCVQASITWNRGNGVARTVESNKVTNVDPENVVVNRIIFQRRVRSEMMSAWIDDVFDESTLVVIKIQNDLYGWRAPNGRMMEDRPMKLKLILEDIQSAKVVGAEVYCQQITTYLTQEVRS